MQLSEVDIRDAVFDRVYELGAKDRNLIVLTDDMDAFGLRRFKRDFPDQYVNIGVAEQNMINLAAGLATCGKQVFAYGIASYVTMRCFEQIKVNLCSMHLPVTIVGIGTGFSFEFDGPTHHGNMDVAVMRSLPEITIYNPSDITFASACVDLAYESEGPVYIRLDKGKFPVLSEEGSDFSDGFRVVKPLREVNVVSTGFMTAQTLLAAEALEERGVSVGVVDLYRLKPISDAFCSTLLESSQQVVTVEESSIIGGVGTIVAEVLAEAGSSIRVSRLAVPDKQFLEYGSREWFHTKNGLDPASLVEAISAVAK